MSKARDLQYKENVITSVIFQIGASAAGYLMVPLALGYVDASMYGLWLVLASIFGWFGMLDFGLGNGLRFKLAEALAKKDYDLSKKYVSTTFFLITVISIVFLIIYSIFHPNIDWAALLNSKECDVTELNQSMMLCVVFFSSSLIFNLINSILMADQRIGVTKITGFITSILTLVCIFWLKTFSHPSFFFLCLAMVVPRVFVLVGTNIFYFIKRYNEISPSLSSIQLSLGKDLSRLGSKYLVSQVLLLIVFATDNIIITRIFGPLSVTPYNIAYKYVSMAILLFTMIVAPSWSAYTEAQTLNDRIWISKTIFRLIKIWVLLVLGLIFLVIISQPFYRLWIGGELLIPNSLTILMAVFAAVSSWNSIFAHYIHGIGKITLFMRVSIFTCTLNIPLSILLATEFQMGTDGVIMATIICSSIMTFFLTIQSYFLLNEKAKGVWNK